MEKWGDWSAKEQHHLNTQHWGCGVGVGHLNTQHWEWGVRGGAPQHTTLGVGCGGMDMEPLAETQEESD